MSNPIIPQEFSEVLLEDEVYGFAECMVAEESHFEGTEDVSEEEDDKDSIFGEVPEDYYIESDAFEDETSDEEIKEVHQPILNEINPLTTARSTLLPRFRIEVQDEALQKLSKVRGNPSLRGRGQGRGSRCNRRNEWQRGQPMTERYINDEELPVELRQDIRRVISKFKPNTIKTGSRNSGWLEECEGDGVDEEDDVFFDAQEEFVWLPMDSWRSVKETFLSQSFGPTQPMYKAYESFRAYWTDDILNHIVIEMNKYAATVENERFRRDWYDTNLDEILILFTFWIMLGLIKMPTIRSCFSRIPILRTDIFRYLFTENRYLNINTAFRLANSSPDPHNPNNQLFSMEPIIDHLNSKFQELYNLEQDICIKESCSWKGRVRFEAARFGIKTYQLCESATGYLWSFFVWTGRKTKNNSVSTVINLIRPLLNLGHVLYLDNWLNSPLLARFLKRNHTDCVGKLQPNHKHVPRSVQNCQLAEGEFAARQSGDVMIVTLNDRERHTYISTFHNVIQVQIPSRSRSEYKFQLIHDYNKGMSGVDRLDQILEPYLVKRNQRIMWTGKLFKQLLNIAIQNARVLVQKSTNSKVSALEFRLSLVQEIIDRHLRNVPPRPNSTRVRHNGFSLSRLTERHFIQRIPVTDEMRQSGKHPSNIGRRRCVLCLRDGKQSKTCYECPDCNVTLCISCFKPFHTVP